MKTVLLGINNPHSSDPSKALGTDPVGASGYRLWLMMKEFANSQGRDLSEQDYMEAFERRNLVDKEYYTQAELKLEKQTILSCLVDRKVIMCGTKVPSILGLKHTGFHLREQYTNRFVYYVIPHPSGLCREYNDVVMRSMVGALLWRLGSR